MPSNHDSTVNFQRPIFVNAQGAHNTHVTDWDRSKIRLFPVGRMHNLQQLGACENGVACVGRFQICASLSEDKASYQFFRDEYQQIKKFNLPKIWHKDQMKVSIVLMQRK